MSTTDMNYRELRRRLMADPRRLDAADEAKLRADPKLAALRDSLLAEDAGLAATLSGIVPPKGLADRIILRARHRRSAGWSLAIAASVALVVGLSVTLVGGRPEAIAVAMIDHVIESPEELRDNPGVSSDEARNSLQRIGVGFRDAGYHIRHIGECVVAGRTGRHLVIETAEGLATLLVLPTKAGELGARRTVSKGNYVAVIMPHANAAIASIGPRAMSPARLEALAKQMFTLES